MKYRHLFFDLDRTLWDFDSSARMAFSEIFSHHGLQEKGIPSVEAFLRAYNIHNEALWSLYREGKIKKEVLRGKRFLLTLSDFGIDDPDLAEEIGREYIRISPLRVALYPHAEQVLQYLHTRFPLHMITNGFSEVQQVKLISSGLGKYFNRVITSEEAGYKKPDERIFNHAFSMTGARPEESIMIGDDPMVDILGAANVGMDQVLFDPGRRFPKNGSTYYINSLLELQGIF